MVKEHSRGKYSRTFSLPVEDLETVKDYAEKEDISESESCRRLLRAGYERMSERKDSREKMVA